jgi:hypothetical protein
LRRFQSEEESEHTGDAKRVLLRANPSIVHRLSVELTSMDSIAKSDVGGAVNVTVFVLPDRLSFA